MREARRPPIRLARGLATGPALPVALWLAVALVAAACEAPSTACTAADLELEVVRSISGLDPDPSEAEPFTQIADMQIGPDHRVYILDAAEGRVQVFDATGRPVGRVGARGEGPGELDVPQALAVDGDRLYVLEGSRTVEVFSTAGDHISTMELPEPPKMGSYRTLAVAGGDLVVGLTYGYGPDPMQRPEPPLFGILIVDLEGADRTLTDTVTSEDLARGSYEYVPTPNRVVALGDELIAAADTWHQPIRFLTRSGRPVWTFEGCLPFEPNADARPEHAPPPDALGGWNLTGGISSLGSGRFVRFNPYTDESERAPQQLEVIDVGRRTAHSLRIPPEDGRWRRFTDFAMDDSVAVFVNRFEGEVTWARIALP